MEKTSKELLKEFVNSQHFTSTTDIMNSMKELFSDVLQTVIEAELEEHFTGEYSIIYLMSKFVQPLLDSGALKLAIPEKPKSQNQRYYTA